MKVGDILHHTAENKNLGVIIHEFPDKLLLFRVDNNTHPTFSKILKQNIHQVVEIGNINQYKFQDIKQHLLKYYRTRNITDTEEKLLQKIMTYSFPNGIPLYNTTELPSEESLSEYNLVDKLIPGECFYINTTKYTPFTHLDNQQTYVMEHTDKGIWVCLHKPTSNTPIYSFLPYLNKDLGTFHGISKVIPSSKDELHYRVYQEDYSNRKKEDSLFSQIEANETKCKVQPDAGNKVILPHQYQGQYYDFKSCKLHNNIINPILDFEERVKSGNVDSAFFDNDFDFSNTKNNNMFSSETFNKDTTSKFEDLHGELSDNEMSLLDKHHQLLQGGTSKKEVVQENIENVSSDDEYLEEEDLQLLKGLDMKRGNKLIKKDNKDKSKSDGNEDVKYIGLDSIGLDSIDTDLSEDGFSEEEFDESQLELFEEDDIVVIGTETKMQQLPVPELEKTFKDDIQRGRIMKQKIEKLPTYKRNNPLFIMDLEKEVNVINIMKNEVTKTDKSPFIQSNDFKPLVESYLKKDFTNPFLIPLVINRKKLYLTPKDGVSVDDFNKSNSKVYENFYKLLQQENERNPIDRKQTIKVDESLKQKISDHTPFLTHENNIGLLLRLGEGIHPDKIHTTGDNTNKSKNTRNKENIHRLQQETLTIRYGEKPYTIENFSATSKMFDAQVQLGPLGRYIKPDKTQITQKDLERMEMETDKYSESVYSNYHIYYYGDAIHMIGFVRPPLKYFLSRDETFNNGHSLIDNLNKQDETDNVIVKYLNKLHNPELEDQETDTQALDEPDKFILYLFPGINRNGNINAEKCNINNTKLEKYLNDIVPTIKDISVLFSKNNSSINTDKMNDILEKFDYMVPSGGVKYNSQLVKINEGVVSYQQYKDVIKPLEDVYLRKISNYNTSLNRMLKLRNLKNKKQEEKNKLVNDKKENKLDTKNVVTKVVTKVVTNDIIELVDKVFPEKLEDLLNRMTGDLAKSDGFRLDYYSRQVDRGEYVELLLRKRLYLLLEKEMDTEKLENTLSLLKAQYESMQGDLEKIKLEEMTNETQGNNEGGINVVKVCKERFERKPKILTYPSLERLEQDNGRTVTNDKGEFIGSGDYAYLNLKSEKMIFKREELSEGDYWIKQPLETLRDLLMKKQRNCEDKDDTMEGKMLLTGEKDNSSDAKLVSCHFDIDELHCSPPMLVEKEYELKEVEKRLNDIISQINFGKVIPQILNQIEKDLHKTEKQIVNYFKNDNTRIEYETKKRLDVEKILENTIYQKQPCTHYQVVDYIEGLTNITPMEKYTLMKQIMDEFQNNEQVATLELNKVSNEYKENYVECFQCQQNLVCKHYYYAIDLMRHHENGELDEDQLIKVFGMESVGSYHCKVCGVFLATTEIKDMEEFAKGQGTEGLHIKTREVRDGINIIERQKRAISNIIKDTLFGVDKDNKKDLEMKLRIFRLGKDLINLEILNMDDELEMFNFMKTTNFTSKKVFFNQIFLLLKMSGKATNTNVINQLAETKYWQYTTCDILGRLLITLQTSKKVYPTYNKLCNSNYMGYPLTSDGANGVDNMNGVNLMISLMKQMSLLKDFYYLGSDSKGFEGLKKILKSRIDFLVNNDEFIRSKLEKALDEKYNNITFDKELENSPTNYWKTYQPNLSLSTISRWTPDKELDESALKNWKGDNVYNMLGVARENLEYHADLIIRNLKKLVGEMSPLTRLTLDTSIGNACCPIYIPTVKRGLIDKEIIGMGNDNVSKGKTTIDTLVGKNYKYINPKISSDKYLIGKNVAIGNSIRKIEEYHQLSKKIEKQLAMDSINFNFINKLRVTRDNIPFNLNLSPKLLRMYFNKYIYSGLFKGETYMFNAFGRCLVSNELNSDIEKMNFTQTDFEKLFHFVNIKNSKVDNNIPTVMESGVEMINSNNEESIVLNNLVNILNTWLNYGLKNIIIRKEVITNVERLQKQLVEAIQNNLIVEMSMFSSFMEQMGNMIDEYNKLWNVCSLFDNYVDCFTNKTLQKRKVDTINIFISMSLEEINKILYSICLDNLKIKVLPKEVFNDKQNMFQIINMLDSITMDTITELVDTITDVNSKGGSNEDILLSVGDYPELVKDYITHLEEQNILRPNINYQNDDVLIENFKNTKKLETIDKIVKDITTIVNTIKNNSWSSLKNTDDINIYMRDFFIFKDNNYLFGKLSSISNILRNVVSNISNTGKLNVNIDGISDKYLFTSEYSSKLGNVCLIWMLNDYLSIIENKKVITLQEMDGGNQESKDLREILDTKEGEKWVEFDTMKSEYETLQGGNYGMIEMDKEELDYYPELLEGGMVDTLENYDMIEGGITNEPGEQIGGDEEDLNSRLKSVKSSQKKVVISFVNKCLSFMKEYTRLYNEMNIGRIEARIAKENERQTRANLDAWIRTSAEGREEDRMVINNLMAIGAVEYKDLNRIENEMFDDNFVGEEIDERQDGPSIRHGLDEFEEMEMGYVGEAEDMEEMDYGYIGVD